MTINIRPARPSDIPAITRVYAHAVEHGTASFELAPPDEAEMARRMEHLLGNDFPYLTAENDSTLCGYAYAGPYRARPAYRWTLEDFGLYRRRHAPSRHRTGLARGLDRSFGSRRLPANDRSHRGFNQAGFVDRPARSAGLSLRWDISGRRLQARALARQRADAKSARRRKYNDAVTLEKS